MSRRTIQTHLQEAAKAVETAPTESLPSEMEGYLDGAVELLTHHTDGGATESESLIQPTPGALDTVQHRLSEIIQEVDGPAAEHLQAARGEIIQAILMLDEQQEEGRPTSSWR